MSKSRIRLDALTIEWDIWRDLRLNPQLIELRMVKMWSGPVYILYPPPHSRDDTPWRIAPTSATTVLLVFHQGWGTMFEAARGLLELVIPFRTIIERHWPPPFYDWRGKSRALGICPRGYVVTKHDYWAYIKCLNAERRSLSLALAV